MIACNSYYGGYRTRSFADIFPSVEVFLSECENSKINPIITQDSLTTLYYILYGYHGNDHIRSSDENTFKYKLFSIIFMYGPTWEKRLEVQQRLRALSEEDLIKGSKAIYNQAVNPSTSPSTSTLEELTYINAQNTTNYKKSKLEGYSTLIALLETDVTLEFINKFKKLFDPMLAPDYPLFYVTPINYETEVD